MVGACRKDARPVSSYSDYTMFIPKSSYDTEIGLLKPQSPAHVRAKSMDDMIKEVQRMVRSENCPEMMRIQVLKAVVPQLEAFMQRACARGEERGNLRTPTDIPANAGTEEDCVGQQVPGAATEVSRVGNVGDIN